LLNLTNSIGSRNNLATPLRGSWDIHIAVLLFFCGNLVLVETLDGSGIVYLTLAFNILTCKSHLKPHVFRKKMLYADRVFEVLEVENEIISKENALYKTL
jgi:subfamily B ATP-binding cassette protein MsbA